MNKLIKLFVNFLKSRQFVLHTLCLDNDSVIPMNIKINLCYIVYSKVLEIMKLPTSIGDYSTSLININQKAKEDTKDLEIIFCYISRELQFRI